MKYLFLSLLFLAGCSYHVSEGERTGIVTKISRKGIVCKTNEATMSLGFTKDGVGTVSKEDWEFTVANTQMLEKVKQFQETNTPVKVYYHDEFACICNSDPCTFLDDIKALQ